MSALQETGPERRKEVRPSLLFQYDTNKQLVQKGTEGGFAERLTEEQLEIFRRRGYFNEGPLVPFRQLDLRDLGITWQAAQDREKRGLRKFASGGRRLTITVEEKEFLEEHPDWSVPQIRMEIGHTHKTIVRWKTWLGLPRRPEGRPRKQT